MSHTVNPGGIRFFESAMGSHGSVESCVEVSSQFYRIKRTRGDILYVYLSGIYVLGSIDYYEIRSKHSMLTTIVLAGQWQNYTNDAKSEAAESEIGVFKIKSFMGSLNRHDHWNYDGPATYD